MPMPAPAVMAAAAPAAGSSFLTGGFGSALGYGLGNSAAGLLGGSLSSKGVNFRGKYERKVAKHKLKYDPQFIAANTRAGILSKVSAAKEAGLHPLAALGIAPGAGTGSPSPAPIIPGQSELGGAIESGIKTSLNVARANQQQAAALEEQQLRNDWLRQQMRHSEIKLAAQLANQRRPSPGGITGTTPGPGPQEPGAIKFNLTSQLPTGTTTSAQDVQDRYGELPEQAMGLFNLGYDTAGYLLPEDFGTGRQWMSDNVPNDYTTGKPIKRTRDYVIRQPHNRGRPRYPRRSTRYHTRFRR